MAIKTISYLALTPEQRREGARVARERLRSLSFSPFLTEDQHAQLREQMVRLDAWEAGTLEAPLAAAH
jgi:hypothetical protein